MIHQENTIQYGDSDYNVILKIITLRVLEIQKNVTVIRLKRK